MVVQPDMGARGPRERSADEGFGVGFEDLHEGHINLLNLNISITLIHSFRYLLKMKSSPCIHRYFLVLVGKDLE